MTFPDENLCDHGMIVCEGCARDAENAACAALVRAAGCVCFAIAQTPAALPRFTQLTTGDSYRGHVTEHDPSCPVVLAAAIEARRG